MWKDLQYISERRDQVFKKRKTRSKLRERSVAEHESINRVEKKNHCFGPASSAPLFFFHETTDAASAIDVQSQSTTQHRVPFVGVRIGRVGGGQPQHGCTACLAHGFVSRSTSRQDGNRRIVDKIVRRFGLPGPRFVWALCGPRWCSRAQHAPSTSCFPGHRPQLLFLERDVCCDHRSY